MSIFTSIKNIFRQRADDIDEALKDPVRDHKFALKDSKVEITKYRAQIAECKADNRRIKRELDAALSSVDNWTQIVAKADAADLENANAELSSVKTQAIELKRQYDASDVTIKQFRNLLSTLEKRVSQAESKHTILKTQKRTNDLRKGLVKASNKFGTDSSPLAQLDALEQDVLAGQDEVEALEEMSVSVSDSLKNKYAVENTSVDADFDELFGEKNE